MYKCLEMTFLLLLCNAKLVINLLLKRLSLKSLQIECAFKLLLLGFCIDDVRDCIESLYFQKPLEDKLQPLLLNRESFTALQA